MSDLEIDPKIIESAVEEASRIEESVKPEATTKRGRKYAFGGATESDYGVEIYNAQRLKEDDQLDTGEVAEEVPVEEPSEQSPSVSNMRDIDSDEE